MSGSWLVQWRRELGREPVLLCLPAAGAGCGQFRQWQSRLGDRVSVVGVQLPGREARWADPAPSSVEEAVGLAVGEIVQLVPAGQPMVVLGHSFGGLLGYEIARALGNRHGRWPRALVVAACRPPHRWVGAGNGLADDDEALAALLDDRALGADDLDEDSRELLLDVLRRDARLAQTYRDPGDAAIACRVEAWAGEGDATVTPDDMAGWRPYAAGGFRQRQFPGGHYFCMEPSPSAGTVLALLSRLASGRGEHRARRGGPLAAGWRGA